MLTNPGEKGDGPGLRPAHWALWDAGTRSQIRVAKTLEKAVMQTHLV